MEEIALATVNFARWIQQFLLEFATQGLNFAQMNIHSIAIASNLAHANMTHSTLSSLATASLSLYLGTSFFYLESFHA